MATQSPSGPTSFPSSSSRRHVTQDLINRYVFLGGPHYMIRRLITGLAAFLYNYTMDVALQHVRHHFAQPQDPIARLHHCVAILLSVPAPWQSSWLHQKMHTTVSARTFRLNSLPLPLSIWHEVIMLLVKSPNNVVRYFIQQVGLIL